MGKELYTNIPSKVGDLISDVKNGRIGLPDLQRPFVWKDNKVRDLLDSMLRGFPIGYIMLWESPAYYDRTSHIGKNDKAYKAPDDLVIDGQQRLTALLAAMTKVGPGAQVKSMGGQVSEQVGEQDREQVGEQDEWIVRLSSMTKMDIRAS